jgi:hypothetical protein
MHRLVLAFALVCAHAACAAGGAGRSMAKSMATPMVAQVSASTGEPAAEGSPTTLQIPEQLVVEGSLDVEVNEVGDLVAGLRAQVEAAGGRVITEQVYGGETSWSASIKVRLPPEQVEPTITWLAKRGDITRKSLNATDVSRTLFDQELALANLTATSTRLQKLLDAGTLAMADILAIEKELTRIRGEIEAIKGNQRFLQDRVALATLDISLSRRDGAVTIARAKIYPGVRATSLILLDPEGRQRTRFGAGLVMHTVMRSVSLEVDVFQAEPAAAGADPKAAVVATFGGAGYSDFLGRGRRRLLNPYLGLRLGYAYLDRSLFVVQAEVGLELFKHKHLVIETSLRGSGFIGKDTDAALIAGSGVVVAF